MKEIRIGSVEKRRLGAILCVLAGLKLIIFTEGFANWFLKWKVESMPILSVSTLVAVGLFWFAYNVVKNNF